MNYFRIYKDTYVRFIRPGHIQVVKPTSASLAQGKYNYDSRVIGTYR